MPDPAALVRRLRPPVLEVDEDAGDDLRRIELRRSIPEISDCDHIEQIALVRAVAARFRRGGDRR
jgi:hypothetical protein